MRLDEFESSQPEVGDILEIEIGNELVETVIVGINRGNYIVESTSTDLLESKLNEVNPHNYDSDLDYYDAVNRSGRRRSSDDYEPADNGPTDDDVHYAKQQAQAKTAPVQKQSSNDGQAPNGERYNTVVTFTSPDNNRNKWAADSYKDYHWGAKKVVDSKEDNGVFTLYVVDNHKHGMWKPWKDQPAQESVNERAEKKEKVKVYVKNPKTGRIVKVDFGDPGQLIKKSKKHRKHGKKRWNLKK